MTTPAIHRRIKEKRAAGRALLTEFGRKQSLVPLIRKTHFHASVRVRRNTIEQHAQRPRCVPPEGCISGVSFRTPRSGSSRESIACWHRRSPPRVCAAQQQWRRFAFLGAAHDATAHVCSARADAGSPAGLSRTRLRRHCPAWLRATSLLQRAEPLHAGARSSRPAARL
jgi:hypothetical protein